MLNPKSDIFVVSLWSKKIRSMRIVGFRMKYNRSNTHTSLYHDVSLEVVHSGGRQALGGYL